MIIKQQRQHNTHTHTETKNAFGSLAAVRQVLSLLDPPPHPLKHTLLAIIKSKQITCYPIYGYIFRALIPSHFIPLDC